MLDLLCDRYIQILNILKLRQFLDYFDGVGKVFKHFKCVCLREYWPFVYQEDTVLSGVTLNFVDCASVFVSTVKNLSNGQFMIEGHFQMHFHPEVSHEFLENETSTNPSGKNAFFMAEPAQQFSL